MREAITYGMASVCVPPCYIRRIHDTYGEKLNICTVIGFPLGYSSTASKVQEAKDAVADGASEIDMVINITDVKTETIRRWRRRSAPRGAAQGKILKVIIETCYLTEEEKIAMCHAVTNAKADYIKTSTGFGTAGAQLTDIALFKANIGPDVKIKAAGGIRTRQAMEDFLAAGCDRIGSSSALDIL